MQMPKIKLHYSLIIYILVCLFSGFLKDFIYIFGILLFHEIGHIIFIKLFNGQIKQLNLSLIGGLMNIEFKNHHLIPNLLVYFGRPH